MDKSFDTSYYYLIPTVILAGILLYLCGFKKPLEPPLFQDTPINIVEKNKKKQKQSKTNTKNPTQQLQQPQEQVPPKEKQQPKQKPSTDTAPIKSNKKQQQITKIVTLPPVITKEPEQTPNKSDANEEPTTIWITVQDKKQKKTQKQIAIEQVSNKKLEESTQNLDTDVNKSNENLKVIETPTTTTTNNNKKQNKLKKSKTNSDTSSTDSSTVLIKSEIVEMKSSNKQQNKKQNEAKKEKDDLNVNVEVVTSKTTTNANTNNDTVSLIRDAVEMNDDGNDSTKRVQEVQVNAKKNTKLAQQQSLIQTTNESIKEQFDPKLQKPDLFKQIQIDESMILIDNSASKTDSNQSSSDSVQEIDDWTHIKPKAKKVRREQ